MGGVADPKLSILFRMLIGVRLRGLTPLVSHSLNDRNHRRAAWGRVACNAGLGSADSGSHLIGLPAPALLDEFVGPCQKKAKP